MCHPAHTRSADPSRDVTTYRLTGPEAALLAGLVRGELRRTARKQRAGRTKWGSDWDPTRAVRRTLLLQQIYRSLGGDPSRISNLPPSGGDTGRAAGDP